MIYRRALIARRLIEEGDKTLAFFRAIPPDQWNAQVYTEGSCWTIRQIMCHFVDAERGLQRIVADVLAGGSGAPDGMDIDLYNENAVARMASWQRAELLEAFAKGREATLAVFENAEDQDFDRTGRHPVLGIKPLDELIKIIYVHNRMHQREIEKVLCL